MKDVKIYVSPEGNDSASGEEKAPIKSFEEAVKRVNAVKASSSSVTVIFAEGEYKTDCFLLTEADSGTPTCPITYKASGKAVINGGALLDSKDFSKVSGNEAERFSPVARKNIYVCDLKKYGITKEMLGPVYAIGAYNMARHYDGDTVGNNVEVFCNDRRMIPARYPNSGFIKVLGVAKADDNSGNTENFRSIRNPKGGVITVDDETASRMKNWREPEKAWLFGYLYWDWADVSSPVSGIDTEKKTVSLRYSSNYGIRENTHYYLYNIPEELDAPNEYYIDRENVLLYLYSEDDINNSTVTVSLSNMPLVYGEKLSYVTFDGFTFEESRNNGLEFKACRNITLKNCTVKNVYSWAISLDGYDNVVTGCDISHTGRGGIALSGGDNKTLTPSNSVAENNLIHDWSEVYLTYNAGINMAGCGLTARHNELARTPHVAILYSGNDHLIEYNYIHETVQQSHDAGSIYAGRNWTAYGTVIRYNIIRNTGNKDYHPAAIYWDDTLAGQTAYGNIIDKCGAKGFLVGGGRDCTVINNIVTGCDECTVMFDDRGREGLLHGGWFNVGLFKDQTKKYDFNESPWIEKYPQVSRIHWDMDKTEDPDFGVNPSRARVNRNILVHDRDDGSYNGCYGCFIAPSVLTFGDVRGNHVFHNNDECFEAGSFEIRNDIRKYIPDFERIPVEKIGIIK